MSQIEMAEMHCTVAVSESNHADTDHGDDQDPELNSSNPPFRTTKFSKKRFLETNEGMLKTIVDLKSFQTKHAKECIKLYKHMESNYSQNRCCHSDAVLKRKKVDGTKQDRILKSKCFQEADASIDSSHVNVYPTEEKCPISLKIKKNFRKLGKSKEDLTYIVNQLKFFGICHRHFRGKRIQIRSFSHEIENEKLQTVEIAVDREHPDPNVISVWEILLEDLKEAQEKSKNEAPVLYVNQSINPAEMKLGLQDSVTVKLDKKTKLRKTLMAKKKDETFQNRKRINRAQIRETPPWKWGNGRYFEKLDFIPFIWESIFDELDTRDKLNMRLVSHFWKSLIEHYSNFVWHAELNDETLKMIETSKYDFQSLRIGPLIGELNLNWEPGCFSELQKITFLPGISKHNTMFLCHLFQHLPHLVFENAIQFQWLLPNISLNNVPSDNGTSLIPFGGNQLTKFELVFTTFSPWHCQVFQSMLETQFSHLVDFSVKYCMKNKEELFGWHGQLYNHFYEVYLSIFNFIALHGRTLKKVTLWFCILSLVHQYDMLPYQADLPWLPGFPNFHLLQDAFGKCSLEEINVLLSPWEQKGVFFWSLSFQLIQYQTKLKKLTIENFGNAFSVNALTGCENVLESLCIRYPGEPFSCILTNQCTKLKEFCFIDHIWMMDRLEDIDLLPKSVEKVELDTYLYQLNPMTTNWIIEHMTNIEELVLSGWAHAYLATDYLALPKLKKLTIINCLPATSTLLRNFCAGKPTMKYSYRKSRTNAVGKAIIRIEHPN